MTPKEKAEELVDKYYPMFTNSVRLSIAKECALITVEECIKANPHSNPFNTDVYSTMDYWQEVKQEIINL